MTQEDPAQPSGSTATTTHHSAPRDRVRLPAALLIGSGVLSIVLALTRVVAHLLGRSLLQTEPGGPPTLLGWLFLVLLLLTPVQGVVIHGGRQLQRLENVSRVKWAAILALMPISLCYPLSLIAGLWTLMVLRDKEVAAAFKQ